MSKLAAIFLAAILIVGMPSITSSKYLGAYAQTSEHPKRLVLKDGSYQIATRWEIHGDRVRYYSVERYAWEEVPTSLVDWPATESYNKEHQNAAGASSVDMAAADAEEKAEREREEAKTPAIAPGIRLPETGGVYLLDFYNNQPQLVELVQNGGELNKQMGKNIMRAVINPLPTGARQSIELKGTHARVEAHQNLPSIYVDIDSSDTTADKAPSPPAVGPNGIGSTPAPASSNGSGKPAQPNRFQIVRLQAKKDSRVVSNVKISLLGKVSNREDIINTKAESVNGGEWVKITPEKPLAPGEYALVEMLGPKEINMYVWDFGYAPNSPPNPTAWKPTQPQHNESETQNTPALNKRPKE